MQANFCNKIVHNLSDLYVNFVTYELDTSQKMREFPRLRENSQKTLLYVTQLFIMLYTISFTKFDSFRLQCKLSFKCVFTA